MLDQWLADEEALTLPASLQARIETWRPTVVGSRISVVGYLVVGRNSLASIRTEWKPNWRLLVFAQQVVVVEEVVVGLEIFHFFFWTIAWKVYWPHFESFSLPCEHCSAPWISFGFALVAEVSEAYYSGLTPSQPLTCKPFSLPWARDDRPQSSVVRECCDGGR